MTKQDRLKRKIANKEKIDLSYGCDTMKGIAILTTLIFILSIISVLYFLHLNYKTLAICIGFSIIYAVLILQFKKYVSASIRGEMLMTETIFKKNKITSIKSIKTLKSKLFFNYDYTKLTYRLDGNNITVRFVNKIDSEHLRGGEIIKTVLKEVG